ncbi:transmembrane protein 198-like [Scophthalmus maximus]|uniref:Transmembrane protein 198 n=1 Tax=Scophthalmus maximus TaxID=52904 RepID=A0A8D3AJP3_SCOMX|nr:transmembrane protein 198-like [Scophthalmus maximus]
MNVNSDYVIEEPGADFAEVDICTFDINMKYEVISSIVCSVCLSFGLIYCFLGYRCFKMVMFLSGFMFGTTAILLFYHKEPVLDIQLGTETKAGIVLAVGVLCGLMTMLLSTMGLLLSGLQLGALLSLVTLVVIGQFHNLTPVWVPLTAILVVSVITATLSLMWQKLFIVVFTSVFGATTVMLSVDYLQGAFMLPDQVYDMLCQVTPPPLCWFNWVIIGICPVLSILGMLVQWRFTAKGVSHTEAAHKKLTKKLDKRHRYRESRGRSRPHRRRRPPPLKRYTGDVLAPSYLQSLQERQLGTGSSTSSVSTITHALIDFDFETGSMVRLTTASPVFTV